MAGVGLLMTRTVRVPGYPDVTTTRFSVHQWSQPHPFRAHVMSGEHTWTRNMDPRTGRWSGPWRLDRK